MEHEVVSVLFLIRKFFAQQLNSMATRRGEGCVHCTAGLYTVNILTVKSTGFTFSSVVSLYFWLSRTVKYAKLVFTISQNCIKRAVKVQGKKDEGKTCTSTVSICSLVQILHLKFSNCGHPNAMCAHCITNRL